MADRINIDSVEPVFTSQARVASPASVEFVRGEGVKGIMLFVDVTAIVTAPSVTISIDVKSVQGNDWEAIFNSAVIVGTGNRIIILYPGAVETSALTTVDLQALPLPVHFRVRATHGNADSITYSVDMHALE